MHTPFFNPKPFVVHIKSNSLHHNLVYRLHIYLFSKLVFDTLESWTPGHARRKIGGQSEVEIRSHSLRDKPGECAVYKCRANAKTTDSSNLRELWEIEISRLDSHQSQISAPVLRVATAAASDSVRSTSAKCLDPSVPKPASWIAPLNALTTAMLVQVVATNMLYAHTDLYTVFDVRIYQLQVVGYEPPSLNSASRNIGQTLLLCCFKSVWVQEDLEELAAGFAWVMVIIGTHEAPC
ncbi:hypothetical protein HG531_006127 [Fusarium graminearum]|nr:hypothetical protein HG531_006127 [Fusarium graminearum]